VVTLALSCTADAAAGLLSETAAARSTGAPSKSTAPSAASPKILVPFIPNSPPDVARTTCAHRTCRTMESIGTHELNAA
jgi:hypothetical protein